MGCLYQRINAADGHVSTGTFHKPVIYILEVNRIFDRFLDFSLGCESLLYLVGSLVLCCIVAKVIFLLVGKKKKTRVVPC